MTGTGEVYLARAEVEDPGEGGHEDAALALQLRTRCCELAVRLREDTVECRLECQHRVAYNLLGHRHQQSCRNALARHIGDQKEQATGSSNQQIVVKVTPDHSCRLDAGVDIDFGAIWKGGEAPRQQSHLDCLRGGKLALNPLRCFAFPYEFRLRSPQAGDQHDTQCRKQSQYREGAIEKKTCKAKQ